LSKAAIAGKSVFSGEGRMNIQISSCAKNADVILKEGMERISEAAKDKPQWKKDQNFHRYNAECDVSENDMIPVFRELIAKYPELDIFASCSHSVREDDRSAQWWSTTTIKTERHRGEAKTLSIDTSTYWA